MAVKVVDKIPVRHNDERLDSLKKDIREIIDKRIEQSEILVPPFPDWAMREKLNRAILQVANELGVLHKIGNLLTSSTLRVFRVSSHKDENDVVHWYVSFDAELWDSRVARINEINEVNGPAP